MKTSIPNRDPDSRTTKDGCIIEVYNVNKHEVLHVIRGDKRKGIVEDIQKLYPTGGYGTTVAFDSDEEALTVIKRGSSCD